MNLVLRLGRPAKGVVIFFGAVILSLTAMFILLTHTAYAGYGHPSPGTGYFYGHKGYENGYNVIQDGVPAYKSKTSFENYITGILHSGKKQKCYKSNSGATHCGGWSVGAAFIIQTMRGGTDRNWPNKSDIADWKARIKGVDMITDNYYCTSKANSDYKNPSGSRPGDAAWTPYAQCGKALKFVNKKDHSKVYYIIRLDCGNPMGHVGGLPKAKHLPPPNHEPKGQITSIKCVNNGELVVKFRAWDADDSGKVSAQVSYAQYTSGEKWWSPRRTVSKSNYATVKVPASKVNNTHVKTVRLYAYDNLPGLPNGHKNIFLAKKNVPGSELPCPSFSHIAGVKISDSKTGKYGGATSGPYKNDRVTVSSDGSSTANPFHFDGISPGKRKVSVSATSDGNWKVKGWSICKRGPSCTSGYLSKNSHIHSGTSFNYNFAAGEHYNMRWIYEQKISDLTCTGPSTMPSPPQYGQPFSVDVGVSYSSSVSLSKSDYKMSVTIDGRTYNTDGSGVTYKYKLTDTTASMTVPDVAFNSPGEHTVKWSFTGPGINQNCGGNNDLAVYALPYANFFGADVAAGGRFDINDDQCATAGESGAGNIIAWLDSVKKSGSGNQFAVLAQGDIGDGSSNTGFGSAMLRSSSPSPIDGLTFANTTSPKGQLNTDPCIPDYYGTKPLGAVDWPDHFNLDNRQVYSFSGGTLTFSGDNIIQSASGANPQIVQIPKNTSVVIYVAGDVTINSDIIYAGADGGWNITGNQTNVPSFTLIAEGNIAIGNFVDELDGTYVAQGSDGSGGVIDTCIQHNFTQCNNQLTVYGSFIAGHVNLNRTVSTLYDSIRSEHPDINHSGAHFGGNPTGGQPGRSCNVAYSGVRTGTDYDCGAEIFIAGPATYLSQPAIPPIDNGAPSYDAVSSLSPVL